MMKRVLLSVCVVLATLLWTAQANGAAQEHTLVLSSISREIDLTTSLVKQKVTAVLLNNGGSPVDQFTFLVDSVLAHKASFTSAKVQSADSAIDLVLTAGSPLTSAKGARVYNVHMPPLASQQTATVVIETIFSNALDPFPQEITQNDAQLIQFTGNVYLLSPYPSVTQSTIVKLPSDKVESFSRVNPTSSSENEIVYGPYPDVSPLSSSKLTVHYENNSPFITVTELERVIEVSHWGNIAVEEHLHIRHIGSTLKGSFSRYDFQRNPNSGPSAVKSYKSLLPAAARDVYYRDEIGNISTSNLREDDEYVELELRPRFPLFGGWQTRYYTGYNLPSYEYIYTSSNQYVLRMRFIDHIFDDQLIEKVTVKIILPEGSKDIQLLTPYPVTEQPQELHFTYLDTIGRPMVVATSENLVEQHIQDFQLVYKFEKFMLLQEPLLVVGVLYLFFLSIIIFVRLDFSIAKDAALLARQQASVIRESILSAHDKRSVLISSYESAISTLKTSEDSKVFKNSKKIIDDKFSSNTDKISNLVKDLQTVDPEGSARVTELQRKMSELKAAIDESCSMAESLVSQRLGKQKYIEQDKANQSRIDRLLQDISGIVQALD